MRRIVIALIALAVLATLPTIPHAAQAEPPEMIIGEGTVHAGLYPLTTTYTDELNDIAGAAWQYHTFGGLFHSIDEVWTVNKLEAMWAAGATPFSNVEFTESAALLAGSSRDAQITAWALKVKDWLDDGEGRSLIIAPMQEMNGDWVPYGMDPTNFKTAYIKIRSIVESTVTDPNMVRWAFSPNGWSTPPYGIADYYPGDAYVDVISFSTYNFGSPDTYNGWLSPAAAIGPYVDEARATIPGAAGKPFLLAQVGSVTAGGDKNQWMRDMFTFIEDDPNLVGFLYFNKDQTAVVPSYDWWIWDNDDPSPIKPGWWGYRDGMRDNASYQFPLTNWFQAGPIPFAQTAGPCPDGMDCDSVAFVDPGSEINLLAAVQAGAAVNAFYYGNPSDVALMGDWNCDGTATPGMYRESNGFVYLRNSNTTGVAEIEFFYGVEGDIPIVGDFNDDGCDTLGIYRAGRVFIKNTLGTGFADFDFWYGVAGDRPFTGDFDGDGVTTVGLYRESTGFVYFRDSLDTGPADFDFFYGAPSDRIMAGDWNGNGIDTVAVYRPSTDKVYFRMTNTFGVADYTLDVTESGFVEALAAR